MTEKRRLRNVLKPTNRSARRGREALLTLDARIKPDFKRAVILGIAALVGLAVGDRLGGVNRDGRMRFVILGLIVGFTVFGAGAVRSAGREVFRVSSLRSGPGTASALRMVLSVVGYGLVLLGVLQLANVNLASLLVGGAVTGVVLGIAAQQTLGSFFAGLVLMFARPYVPGQRVVVHSGALGGPFEGTIIDAGLLYTTIVTDEGPVNLPNAGLLASAVGPAPERTHDADQPALIGTDPENW